MEAPAICSGQVQLKLRLMTTGLRMSTPALRASAAEVAPISTYMFSMSRAWRILIRAVQVDGNSGDDAVNPFAAGGANFHGLRGIELVEDRRQAGLRQALQAQVTVVGDSADDEAGLVDRRDDQAMRRAAADGDDHVAEIVHDGMKRRELRANFFRELIFVAGNGGRFDEFLQVVPPGLPGLSLARRFGSNGLGADDRKEQDENSECARTRC